jgi:HD-GYP domain-containing protein (c-di-GMP phosphodiesterase class II)
VSSKLKSKDINAYFGLKLSDLIVDRTITFDIHLYFPQNQHIMVFRKKETSLAVDFFSEYARRGIEKIWILNEDQEAYNIYLNPTVTAPAESVSATPGLDAAAADLAAAAAAESARLAAADTAEKAANEKIEREAKAEKEAATEAAMRSAKKSATTDDSSKQTLPEDTPTEKVLDLIKDQPKHTEAFKQLLAQGDTEDKKTMALLAKRARTILKQSTEPSDIVFQQQANSTASRIVKEILAQKKTDATRLLGEIWNLSATHTDFVHSSNVATYTVLLALAFGKTDPDLLADLALAGLLHDVGVSQVSVDVVTRPWTSLSTEGVAAYAEHVSAGLELINGFGPDIPDRVKSLIRQHHEKISGHGYPHQLQGFGEDGAAQLLAIAEHVDSIASGQWDGKKRTYKEALETLEHLEQSASFPEYFNPEILAAVIRWTNDTATAQKQPDKGLKDQMGKLLGKAA